jgi:hypothetical protein
MPTKVNGMQRYWPKVRALPNGCWLWTGRIDRDGYGRIGGKLAHRVGYERLIGPIPDGLTIDHLCRNRPCVYPAHLEPVSQRVNTLRGVSPSAVNARKTHCSAGHGFDERNTYLHSRRRACRQCNSEAARRYEERRKVA